MISSIFKRVKQLFVQPNDVWDTIREETPDVKTIFLNYVLPLAIILPVAKIFGWLFIGTREGQTITYTTSGWNYIIFEGLIILIVSIATLFIAAFIISLLSETFKAKENFPRSFQLISYTLTPIWVGGVFYIVPALSFLGGLLGLYSFLLFYFGFQKMINIEDDLKISFFILSVLLIIVAHFFVRMIINVFAAASGAL